MEMQQVRYFLALARTLNFTRAAEQANVTQPALTRAIQQLEHELGGPLFHRERNRTHLTELGRMMLPYLEQIHTNTEAAREHARTLRSLDDTNLRLGVMCTIGPGLFADFLISFRMRHPGVRLEIRDDSAGGLIDMLQAGELDVALFGMPEGPDIRFHALPLYQERFVAVMAPEHPAARLEAVSCGNLHGSDYVSRSKCEFAEQAGLKLREQGVRWNKVFSSERDDWVQAMIKAGMGFGFFPEMAMTDPGLVSRRLIEPEFVRTIMLVTVRGRPHSTAVGAFVQAARTFPWPASQFGHDDADD